MKNKSWLYLISALGVFAVALYTFISDHDRGGRKSLQNQFSHTAPDKVAFFELSAKGMDKMHFTRADDDTWWLNDSIVVDILAVTDMLTSLERLQVRSPVAAEIRQQVLDQLDETGVKVKLFAKRHWITLPGNIRLFARKQLLHEIIVGDDLMGGDATYVSAGKDRTPYVVYRPGKEGGISRFFTMKKHFWTDPVVISIEPADIKQIKLHFFDSPDESFQLVIDGSAFYFINDTGNKIDNALINKDKLGRFMNAFRQLRHERKFYGNDGHRPDDILSYDPFLHIAIKNTAGVETRMSFFRRKIPDDGTLVSKQRYFDPNRFYVKTEDGNYALAQYFVFQPIMRPLSYFIE